MTRSEWCALSSWLGWTEVSEARLDRVAAGWTSEDWLGLSRLARTALPELHLSRVDIGQSGSLGIYRNIFRVES